MSKAIFFLCGATFLIAAAPASAAVFKCAFKDQPVMMLDMAYPDSTLTIGDKVYPLAHDIRPAWDATVEDMVFEFEIKSYGPGEKTMPTKLEIHAGSLNGPVVFSEKTACQRAK